MTLEASHGSLTKVEMLHCLLKARGSQCWPVREAWTWSWGSLRGGDSTFSFYIRCPEFQQLIPTFPTGQTTSVPIPQCCSLAFIRLTLEYLKTSRLLPEKWLSTCFH